MLKKSRPLIVAVVASLQDLEYGLNLPAGCADLCELRIDLLPRDSDELLPLVRRLELPKIVTVRDPAEGGANALNEELRLRLLEQWLPECRSIDIELRNLSYFAELARDAQSKGKEVIISFHDFVGTPPFEALVEMVHRSAVVPHQIFKVATVVESWKDLQILVRLIETFPGYRLAVMGMGTLGKLSRLVLARAGSCLCYGSLGDAIVSGQWPVLGLRTLLAEIWS
jgi:3-dehydroquinate dehydratase I